MRVSARQALLPTTRPPAAAGRRSLFRPRPLCFLASLCLLAVSGAARAANYAVQATVTDIDGRPVPGIQVAVGAIQTQPFKTGLQPEQTGTTDATGQVTVNLSTNSSPVGATVVGEDPGRVHLPAGSIVSLAGGSSHVAFQLLPLPDAMLMAAGGTASARGYFSDTGTSGYPPLDTQSFTLDASALQVWRAYGASSGPPILVIQGLFPTTAHPTPMQVFNQAFDLVQAMRHAGRDVLAAGVRRPAVSHRCSGAGGERRGAARLPAGQWGKS